MSIFRSHKHLYCQLIDDAAGRTLCSASTRDKSLSDQVTYGGNAEAAKLIGQEIAKRAQQAGIHRACFDRGPYRYHGRVAAVADAAREAGLQL